VDIFASEGVLEQLAQRLQVLLHGDVVKVALAGFAPHHQRHGSERLAMDQHFAAGDRRSVHDVRVAGGNPRDVGRIVDDDALSDRQANLFRAALSEKPGGSPPQSQQPRQDVQLFDSSHGLLSPARTDSDYFHALLGSANHHDLIGRRRRRRRRGRGHHHRPGSGRGGTVLGDSSCAPRARRTTPRCRAPAFSRWSDRCRFSKPIECARRHWPGERLGLLGRPSNVTVWAGMAWPRASGCITVPAESTSMFCNCAGVAVTEPRSWADGR
jgi:hypothetical protein